jgi:hypothetical protein
MQSLEKYFDLHPVDMHVSRQLNRSSLDECRRWELDWDAGKNGICAHRRCGSGPPSCVPGTISERPIPLFCYRIGAGTTLPFSGGTISSSPHSYQVQMMMPTTEVTSIFSPNNVPKKCRCNLIRKI